MAFLKRIKIPAPTIARDLTFSLVAIISIVFGVVSTANYFFTTGKDEIALQEKADELLENLALVLVQPLWNIDNEEIKKIVSVYRESEIVVSIQLLDENDREVVFSKKNQSKGFLILSRTIYYDQKSIGTLTVTFTNQSIQRKLHDFAIYNIIIFSLLAASLMLVTTFLVKRLLNEPFDKLKKGLELISGGTYQHRFDDFRHEDLNQITQRVMLMAREIANRQNALEGNQQKLEILNQAILDIFSCSDTKGLVRTTLELAHKICGVDFGWFIGHRTSAIPREDEKQAIPTPWVCVRGYSFEASEEEVEPYVWQETSDKIFSFSLRSRYRQVGQMTLSFEKVPDPATSSLLKSLMSLASLGLIRQAFIRETAFITAELQVAETVQRTMLADAAKAPHHAVVAYHYEPVLRVGGDWFHVIESHNREEIYAILGDVTGHGLAQGLVTTAVAGALQVIQSLIYDSGFGTISRPSQIVTQLSKVITRIAGKSNLRMTCVVVKLELTRGKLMVCNAGHTFPILVRRNEAGAKAETLTKKQQHMLGEDYAYARGFEYSDAEYDISMNDVLLLYTDGLTDAMDKEGKSFSRKLYRFFSRLREYQGPEEIKNTMIQLLRSHVKDVPVKDDICVLAISRKDIEKAA